MKIALDPKVEEYLRELAEMPPGDSTTYHVGENAQGHRATAARTAEHLGLGALVQRLAPDGEQPKREGAPRKWHYIFQRNKEPVPEVLLD